MIAVAAVLSNWHNVLRAINMASSKEIQRLTFRSEQSLMIIAVAIPKPKMADGEIEQGDPKTSDVPLPQTLVRIPVQEQS